MVAAVTPTAGNVLFAGELTGDFLALDARTGEVLYRFNTGGPMGGGVVTYEAGGRQYVAVASGSPPDLVYMERRLLGTYAAKNALIPLGDCVQSESIDLSQFRDAALSEATLNGKLYGLPDFFNNRVLMINDA